ncbi:DUF3809 domain-containing protein [Deinococcus sp. YIM 134068]|uniref:DUF3809 domain-containing protein n=1 Tax=Deinococcus lichenicola TaxID=3118910 RepID=UPI002F926448
MLIEAEQRFTLTHPRGREAALAFVRDAGLSLARVRFLRGLAGNAEYVSGELVVPVPVLGEVDLPFRSLLSVTPDGAALTPQPLTGERAWVEVGGRANVDDLGAVAFHFHFRAHLQTPQAEGWGGAAFEKMVRAAAARTLERVAGELPQGIQTAME